jgi:hypothetical protein
VLNMSFASQCALKKVLVGPSFSRSSLLIRLG